MTDRPSSGAAAGAPAPGYYADPSIPGFVRYWDGRAWAPGTSRPEPRPGEVLQPPRVVARPSTPSTRFIPPPSVPAAEAPQQPAPAVLSPQPGPAGPADPGWARPAAVEESGPLYFDETSGGASFSMSALVQEPPLVLPQSAEPPPAAVLPSSHPGAAAQPGPTGSPGSAAQAEQHGPPTESGRGAPSGRRSRPYAPGPDEEHPSGWQADARQQRGLMESQAAPRWVSWGVLETGRQSTAPEDPSGSLAPAAGGPSRAGSSAPQTSAGTPAPNGGSSALPRADRGPVRTPEPGRSRQAGADGNSRAAAGGPPGLVPVADPTPAGSRPAVPQPGRPDPARPDPARPEPVRPKPARSGSARHSAPKRSSSAARRPGRDAPAPGRRRPAGFGRRLFARVVDGLLVGALAAAAGIPLASAAVDHLQAKIDAARLSGHATRVWLVDPDVLGSAVLFLMALLVVGFLYEALPTARSGRTLGKRLVGLRVLDTRSHQPPGLGGSVRRWLLHVLLDAVLVGLLNSLWCLFDRPLRQCWHDKVADTFVAADD